MPSNIFVGSPINDVIIPGVMKPSIIVFDTNPGTRNVTLPPGRYRIAAVGAGSGGGHSSNGPCQYGANGGAYSEKVIEITTATVYSYTVGTPGFGNSTTGNAGGASSFAALITANGGAAPGTGSAATATGGDINSNGGYSATSGFFGGASSGHRFGAGLPGLYRAGAGWAYVPYKGSGNMYQGGPNYVDGFGLGLPAGTPSPVIYNIGSTSGLVADSVPPSGYGCGATCNNTSGLTNSNNAPSSNAGMGGGGASHAYTDKPGNAGIGGGGATGETTSGSDGGTGLIIVEKLA